MPNKRAKNKCEAKTDRTKGEIHNPQLQQKTPTLLSTLNETARQKSART